MEKGRKQTLPRRALVATLPVLAGYMVLGMGFGMLLKARGYSFIWAPVMSMFIYAGSMQYILLDLLGGGASLLTVALTSLMVNARHLFYSISLVDAYRGAGAKKPYMIFALTDETYSLVCTDAPADVDRHRYWFLLSLLDQIWWVCGSVLGAMLGTLLHINTEGIDFSLTALFVTVFVEQWLSTKNHGPALVGVGVSVAALLLFGSGEFLIPAMAGITALLSLGIKRRREAEE